MQIWAQIGLKHEIRTALELVTSWEEIIIYFGQASGPSGWDPRDKARRHSWDVEVIFLETSLEALLGPFWIISRGFLENVLGLFLVYRGIFLRGSGF